MLQFYILIQRYKVTIKLSEINSEHAELIQFYIHENNIPLIYLNNMGCSGSAEQAKQAKNKNEMKGSMTSQFSSLLQFVAIQVLVLEEHCFYFSHILRNLKYTKCFIIFSKLLNNCYSVKFLFKISLIKGKYFHVLVVI